MRWHHVRTADGWEIRDENALLVASLVNPAHDREDDARMLADAPRLRERLNRYETDAPTQRARLVKEQIAWNAMTWFSGDRSRRFHAALKRLAKLVGRDVEDLAAEIRAEAAREEGE